MPTQTNLESPSTVPLPTLNNLFYDFSPRTLRGIDVWEDGDISVVDIDGNAFTRTFTGITGGLPFRWSIQIQKIYSPDTTVPLGSMDFLH